LSTARHVYERHVAAFNAKDGGADPWSPDAELVAPGTELHGRGEVIDFLRVYWEAFPDARQEITRLVADGPIVSAEGEVRRHA
jgi:predicted ester cyclase